MAGEPRIEFRMHDPDHYPRIRYYAEGREWYVYLHRLVGYAHGIVESPFRSSPDSPHVHHVDHDRKNNRPGNLEARPPDGHSQYHATHNHDNGRW